MAKRFGGLPALLAALSFSLLACTGQRNEVSVQIIDWDATRKLVESKKGKVVVLDIWSTTCGPCVREFPNLVALREKHGDADLACISVSCDYIGRKDRPPEYYKADVMAFLEKRRAFFDNVLLSTEADELFQKIDLGSIPTVYVWARDGALAKRFDNDAGEYGDGGFTYKEHIIPLVEKLIAGK